jgi:hypothetical protein
MHRVREGFYQTRAIPVEARGEFVQERTGHDDTLSKAARLVRAKQNASSTQLGFATLTELARSARDKRIHGHATSVVSRSYELMSHDERRNSKARTRDAVKFAPADSGALDVHDDLIISGDDVINIFHFYDF